LPIFRPTGLRPPGQNHRCIRLSTFSRKQMAELYVCRVHPQSCLNSCTDVRWGIWIHEGICPEHYIFKDNFAKQCIVAIITQPRVMSLQWISLHPVEFVESQSFVTVSRSGTSGDVSTRRYKYLVHHAKPLYATMITIVHCPSSIDCRQISNPPPFWPDNLSPHRCCQQASPSNYYTMPEKTLRRRSHKNEATRDRYPVTHYIPRSFIQVA